MLRFLADNQSYYDFLKELDRLTDEQKQVLFQRLKSEIGNRPKDNVNAEVIEIVDKVVKPAKLTRELEDKPQTTIECCVHCGSIAIKKH